MPDKITIHGPKSDGGYIVEFRGVHESLTISVPGVKATVLRHFQEKMPYGLVVPDVPRTETADARAHFPRFRRRDVA